MFSQATVVPRNIRAFWEVYEWRHASVVLANAFPDEWEDILGIMTTFKLSKEDVFDPGKNKSSVSSRIDKALYERGWKEKKFDTQIMVDGKTHPSPTHSIDCFKSRIGLEIEWNNKDPFFDRDLNNFRLLHELDVLSVGVIITRSTEILEIFRALGRGKSSGASTTHMSKLLPKIEGGGAGGCPVLVLGITKKLYQGD
ncbi:MAG: restriction endonuclease [Alphaproteobacteria bacterium]|nr:restriction endonuclease [Alphaproteobacteria bacterium]